MPDHPIITDHPAKEPTARGLAPDRCLDCGQPLAWHTHRQSYLMDGYEAGGLFPAGDSQGNHPDLLEPPEPLPPDKQGRAEGWPMLPGFGEEETP